MDFGIKCVIVCAFDWLLFVSLYLFSLSRRLDSIIYYPDAHSRHLGVNSRVLRTGTFRSSRDNTNNSTSPNAKKQTAEITLK